MILAIVLAIVTVPQVPMPYFPQWVWLNRAGNEIELAQPPADYVYWDEDPANCESDFNNVNIGDGNPLANRCESSI